MAAKKVAQSGITTIGLDIGYGVTKCVTVDKTLKFPSVIGFGRELKFQQDEIARKHPGDQLFDDEGHWFAGELALSQLRSHEQLKLRGRGGNEWEFRARLAKIAIGKLFNGDRSGDVLHVRIATGLPVDHMRDAGLMKQALLGQHVIKTDSTSIVLNVSEVMVMPQPYGTIYANMLHPDGTLNECHTAFRTAVVDVGTYTVDLTVDEDGEYIDSMSGSVESGVYTAQERIAATIEAEYRQKPDLRLVEEVLRTGCITVRGVSLNFGDEVEDALQPLRETTLNLLAERWKLDIGIDVIYLSGGGAELVCSQLQEKYPQCQMVKDAQMANARGYFNYAQFKKSNG